MFGHPFQTFGAVNLQRFLSTHGPGGQDEIRVSGSMVGVKMGYKDGPDIDRIELYDPFVELCCSSTPDNPWTEIDQIGAAVYYYGGRRT